MSATDKISNPRGRQQKQSHYRNGRLLLLYAQPLVKVVALQLDDIDDGMSIALGQRPTDVPEPFATLLRTHIALSELSCGR